MPLTPTEFELLATLAREPGRVWTRSQLLDAVHGFSLESYERAIDGHVRNLRRKLEAAASRRATSGPSTASATRSRSPPVTDRGPGEPREPAARWRWDASHGGAGSRRWGASAGGPGPWAGRRGGRGRAGRAGAGFIGCLLLALIVFVGVVTALATWVAAVLLGVLSPGAAPPTATAVAVVVVLVVVVILGGRASSRPCARSRTRRGLRSPRRRRARRPGPPRGPVPVRRLGASFNAMAERLDRSRDDRRALLADVTHELRTPLTVIAGGLEAMLDGVHPMDEDHVSPILAEATVMDRLLDDLRTISLAEAGALPLHREPVDLVELAADVLSSQRTVADARRVELTALAGDHEVEADVDPVRVREILVNLVANALRHTQADGRVTIEVRASGADAVLAVVDTGEGIAPEELDRVFDRFHRRSDSGGSGLGLTIVRDLAAAHGGSVEVESEGVPGRGSTFRVRLPRRL